MNHIFSSTPVTGKCASNIYLFLYSRHRQVCVEYLSFHLAGQMASHSSSSYSKRIQEVLDSLIEIPTPAEIRAESKLGKVHRKRVWEKVKVATVAKLLCSVYASTLLGVLLKVQWTLLGKYMYLESIFSEHPLAKETVGLTEEEQKKFAWVFLEYFWVEGLEKLAGRCVMAAAVAMKE